MNEQIVARAEKSTGMSIDDYHAAPYLSASKLSDFAKRGPRYFAMRHVQRNSPPPAQTEAQLFGQAFEDLVCEPMEVFRDRYAIKPADMTFTTKEGKAWRNAQVIAGKHILTQDAVTDLHSMREAMWENETACSLVRDATQQVTLRAPYAGTPGIQSRPDFMGVGNAVTSFAPYTVDLKTTIHFARLLNGRGVVDYRYHVQAALAHYCFAEYARSGSWRNGERTALQSYLLVVEKCAPYRCQVVAFTPEWIEAGWRWSEAHLERIARHYATGTWPRTEREMSELPKPPPWLEGDMEPSDEEEAA